METDDKISQADSVYAKRMKAGSARLKDAVLNARGEPAKLPEIIGWKDVLRVVCRYYRVDPCDVIGRRDRHKYVQRARAVTFLTLRERGNTYDQIGSWFEGRCSSAIVHASKIIAPSLNEAERDMIDELARAKIRRV